MSPETTPPDAAAVLATDDGRTEFAPKRRFDEELAVLNGMIRSMEDFDEAARARMIAYLASRFPTMPS